ncbi:MAG: hypothetical protein OJF51_004867 [Nitrospira sp.]|jgi:hypothetical protein|nr:MAG: hypothetical protein OJF51_004867 [Nitrospira sp.]
MTPLDRQKSGSNPTGFNAYRDAPPVPMQGQHRLCANGSDAGVRLFAHDTRGIRGRFNCAGSVNRIVLS